MLATPAQTNQLIDFFHTGRKLVYRKGDTIIRPEDPPGGIFFIDSGFVKAFVITKYGEENLLIIRKNHELFPLLWAITDIHREVFYEAMDLTQLWRVSKEDFLNFINSNPSVMPVMVDMAVEMYRVHAERVNNLEYRSVKERVISFLITSSVRFGKPTAEGIIIDIPLRRQDIAASINATRETTSRELIALTRKGYISEIQQRIVIHDLEKLKTFL